jgi:signal transduction histidine kinase
MVSHQLKSPAATVKECLDVLLARFGPTMPAECLDLMRRADARAEFLLRLMDDWLTLAKLESDGARPAAVPVSLDPLLGEAITRVKQVAPKRKVALELQKAAEPVNIRGDAVQLRELFVNLLDNAVRYTPDGGTVTVQIAREGDGARVSVADNGPGIPLEEQGLIFEPFFRGAEAKKQAGTGLGLSIVKQIVEAHGGHVGLDSAVGRGTVFTVHLPAAADGRRGRGLKAGGRPRQTAT